MLSLAFAFMAVGCGRKTEAPTTSKTKLVEHQAPTIVAQDVTIAVNERFVPTRYATATDEDGTDISADIEYTGNVDYTKAGTYQATYTVTDKNGMTATKTITVKVVSSDKEAPLLSGAGNVTVPITGDFDPKAGVKAIDTVDGDISSKIQVTGEVDVKHLGEYTLKYTVTDEAGNKAEATRKVTVSTGKFVFAEEDKKTGAKVTADLEALNEIYTFGVLKVEYTTEAANASVTLTLGNYSVTTVQAEAGTHVDYVRYDAAVSEADLTVTGATLVSWIPGGCPDIVAPVLTGNFNQTFVISRANRDLAAQFVVEMAEAVAQDDTDGFITDKCYLDLEGFNWDSNDEQDALLCVADKVGNVTSQAIKVIAAAETLVADLTPVGEGPDTSHDNNSWILMYRNLTMSKQDDGAILCSDMVSGGYMSHQMIKYDLSNLSYGNFYVLKLTAKFVPVDPESTQETQTMGYRIGQSLGGDPWYDEFSGFSYDYFNLTREYVTSYHIFKYDVTEEDAKAKGEPAGAAMEFQLGNTTYYTLHNVAVMKFEIYLVSNENQAPSLKQDNSLPTILVKGSEAPDLAKYVSALDVEDGVLTPEITGSVDMTTKGVYPVKYSVTDSEGKKAELTINFEVLNEADTVAPKIEWIGEEPLPTEVKIDEFTTDAVKAYFLQNIKITDQKDGETINMAVADAKIDWGNINMSSAGKYKISVSIKDDSGNEGTFEHTIKVVKEAQGGAGAWTLLSDYMTQSFTQEKVTAELKDGVIEMVPTTFEGGGWASYNKSKMELLAPFEIGRKYKLVVEAKADVARTVAFSFSSADTSWSNYGAVGKIEAVLGTEYEKFEVEFVYTGKFTKGETEYTIGYTALELQLGNIKWDAGETLENKVYIRKIDLYEENYGELVGDYMKQSFTQEKVTAEVKDGVFVIVPTT